MQASDVAVLLERLEQIVFLLQACCLALCFLCGFISMQFIIHSKNQKNLF